MANLFLGGMADGTWKDVDPSRDSWEVAVDRPVHFVLDEPTVFDGEQQRLIYRRIRMAIGRRETASLFVLSGIPDDEVFAMLLRGYRQGVPVHPPAAYNEGYERGWRAGLQHAIRIVRGDNPVGPAAAWDVFRQRVVDLLTVAVRTVS